MAGSRPRLVFRRRMGFGFYRDQDRSPARAAITFLTLRFAFGIACLVPVVVIARPQWPACRAELRHIVIAGLLRTFCPLVDLRAASLVQFVATLLLLAPLAWLVEGAPVIWSWSLAAAIVFLVIGASILASTRCTR